MDFTPAILVTLNAVLDRLIPADDWPGALAAGVHDYIGAQLRGDCAEEAPSIILGLLQLDVEAAAISNRASFVSLTVMQQDGLLSCLEKGTPATTWPVGTNAGAFFNRLIELAHEGFYADPGNGGNRDAVSWRMIGYDPHLGDSSPRIDLKSESGAELTDDHLQNSG